MGRPKKQRPEDPLFAHAREDLPRLLPALRGNVRSNTLSSGARKLLAVARDIFDLEAQIAALNETKSALYKELKSDGFDMNAARRVIKEGRIDPIVREERQRYFDTYWDAFQHAAAVVKAEQAAGEDAA